MVNEGRCRYSKIDFKRYLELYDSKTGLWGGGVYGPKWISTHYTMLELKYMALEPNNAAFHTGLGHIIDHEWRTTVMTQPRDGLDVFVLGMVVHIKQKRSKLWSKMRKHSFSRRIFLGQ